MMETKIEQIILKLFNMEKNGQFLVNDVNTEIPLDISRGNGNRDYIGENIYKKLSELLEEGWTIEGFTDRFLSENNAAQVIFIIKGETCVTASILIKWYTANMYNVEYQVQTVTPSQLMGLAVRGLLDLQYKFNYSKLYLNQSIKQVDNQVISYLSTNELSDYGRD